MKFFQGDVAEAVAEREDRGVALVVFVEGADGLSGIYRLILEEEERLPREAYVAVNVPFRSDAYDKFADIYRVVPVPSVFVIGTGGLPLAVVSSATEREEIFAVLNAALAGHRGVRTVRILLKLPSGNTVGARSSPRHDLPVPEAGVHFGGGRGDPRPAAAVSDIDDPHLLGETGSEAAGVPDPLSPSRKTSSAASDG
ncbi:UNVERIFIED_CONTAM: hypothetical protein PYX00_000627 [Menopon gallinae]|uniref:Uncharacterized protein n=1 Tax=Menopon gallinae TaxID=328185 RepID=A0AAW2IAS3_9NEOP